MAKGKRLKEPKRRKKAAAGQVTESVMVSADLKTW